LKYDIRNSLAKRAIVHERTSLEEMLCISQPELTNLVDLDFYNFDVSAGKDVSLYLIDSGAKKHEYYPQVSPRWLRAGSYAGREGGELRQLPRKISPLSRKDVLGLDTLCLVELLEYEAIGI